MSPADSAYAVRPATEADLAAVLHVLAQNLAVAPQEGEESPAAVSRPQSEMWERIMCTDDLTVYIAERAAEIVATASMLVMPNLTYDCHPTAFIEAVVVKYAHRRRGVARLLMQRALHDAAAVSCRKVQLLSHKRHAVDGAHELYRSLGFVAEAEGFRRYIEVPGQSRIQSARSKPD